MGSASPVSGAGRACDRPKLRQSLHGAGDVFPLLRKLEKTLRPALALKHSCATARNNLQLYAAILGLLGGVVCSWRKELQSEMKDIISSVGSFNRNKGV